jgi:hypothetical protein
MPVEDGMWILHVGVANQIEPRRHKLRLLEVQRRKAPTVVRLVPEDRPESRAV